MSLNPPRFQPVDRGIELSNKFTYQKNNVNSAKQAHIDYDDNSSIAEKHEEQSGLLHPTTTAPSASKIIEFTNNLSMIRLVRLVIFIQYISLMIDQPQFQLPIIFHILCRGILVYSIKFYSRVFIDIVNIIQLFYKYVIPSSSSSSANSSERSNVDIDFVTSKVFHTISHYVDYFNGMLFVVLVVNFTLFYWEFHDFTERKSLINWIREYVADGWWRRGGLKLLLSVTKGVLFIGAISWLLYAIAKQGATGRSFPDSVTIGAIIGVGVCIIGVVWILGLLLLRSVEAAFVRYVSQNISYGSVLVLKRVVKAKTEIGIALMFALYIPVLYVFTKALVIVTDWNDYSAGFRANSNFFTPCYFLAFPPFHGTNFPAGTCAVAYANSPSLPISSRKEGYYENNTILPCDSLLGVVLYVTSFCMTFAIVFGFCYIVYSMIDSAANDFKESRRVQAVKSLQVIRNDENKHFVNSFALRERLALSAHTELQLYISAVGTIFSWTITTALESLVVAYKIIRWIVWAFISPILFVVERLLVLSCLNKYTREGYQQARNNLKFQQNQEKLQQSIQKATNEYLNFDHDNIIQDQQELWDYKPVEKVQSILASESSMKSVDKLQSRHQTVVSVPPAYLNGARGKRSLLINPYELGKMNRNRSSHISFNRQSSMDSIDKNDLTIPTYLKQSISRISIQSSSKKESVQSQSQVSNAKINRSITRVINADDISKFQQKGPSFNNRQSLQSSSIFLANNIDGSSISSQKSLSQPSNLLGSISVHQAKAIKQSIYIPNQRPSQHLTQGSSVIRHGRYTSFTNAKINLIRAKPFLGETGDENNSIYDELSDADSQLPPLGVSINAYLEENIYQPVYKYFYESIWEKYILSSYYVSRKPVEDLLIRLGVVNRKWKIQGQWRIGLQLESRANTLNNIDMRLIEELRKARDDFVQDDQLSIIAFDSTIPTSGLFVLLCQYRYSALYTSLVLVFDMTIYTALATCLSIYTPWVTRTYILCIWAGFIGLVYFIYRPFTEEIDNWHELVGRGLVIFVGVGSIIAKSLAPVEYTEGLPAPLYNPKTESHTLRSIDASKYMSYYTHDAAIVFYFFFYIYYMLRIVGVFNVVADFVRDLTYRMHDHTLDFLIAQMEDQTVGFENIYTGLSFIQQWDDVLASQRRYLFLTYPDMRPSTLIPWYNKLIEVQWASVWGLNIGNLRSSLGLTLLHASLCSANTEISKWLIHNHPQLLNQEDSQRDTPIMIALKECAYYLLTYGAQNNGKLDDGTGYGDDEYNTYYPEIEIIRSIVDASGEFIMDHAIIADLNARELQHLEDYGFYLPITQAFQVDDSNSSTAVVGVPKQTAKSSNQIRLEEEQKAHRIKKKQAMEANEMKRAEMESIFKKRFVEDDVVDDPESGQMTAWKILGLHVPEVNLFLDAKLHQVQMQQYALTHEGGVRSPTSNGVENQQTWEEYYISHGLDPDELEAQKAKAKERNIPKVDWSIGNRGRYAALKAEIDLERGDVIDLSNEYARSGGRKADLGIHNGRAIKVPKKLPSFGLDDTEHLLVNQRLKTPKNPYLERRAGFETDGIEGDHDTSKGGWMNWLGGNNQTEDSQPQRRIPKDLEYSLPTNKRILDIDTHRLPYDHADIALLTDWINPDEESSSMDSLILSKKSVMNMSMLNRISIRGLFRRHINNENTENMNDMTMNERLTLYQRQKRYQHLPKKSRANRNDDGSHEPLLAGLKEVNRQPTPLQREVVYQLCKFTEIFLSEELTSYSSSITWDLSSYKAMSASAAPQQAKLAQHLAMVLHLNPPRGFAVITEWMDEPIPVVYDNLELLSVPIYIKSAVAVVGAAESAAKITKQAIHTALGSGPSRSRKAVNIADHDSNEGDIKNKNNNNISDKNFPDRVVHYLAEALVASRGQIDLADNELSVYGRKGWRAISRAYRRNNCTFLLPSVFIGTKPIILTHLSLSRNGLDDGDAVLLTEIILYQQTLLHLDLSFNRIGSHGLSRMAKVLSTHESVVYFNASHNDIGPVAGKDIHAWLKATKMLKVLDLSHNLLGEMVRYPTLTRRVSIESATKSICLGLRHNKSLHRLDISYNNLGPTLADYLPNNIARHPCLKDLNISGNNLGPKKGPVLIYALAGEPNGEKILRVREKLYLSSRKQLDLDTSLAVSTDVSSLTQEEKEILDILIPANTNQPATNQSLKKDGNTKTLSDENKTEVRIRAASLSSLSIADNQLGSMAGYSVASFLINNPSLTALDLSRNSLGYLGGETITDAMRRTLNFSIRSDNLPNAIHHSRYRTNLVSLDLSYNNLGPKCFHALMKCSSASNATLTYLNISGNPLGYSDFKSGDADRFVEGVLSKGLTVLNLADTGFSSTQLVHIMTGIKSCDQLTTLTLSNSPFDEPTCLQCAYALNACNNLQHLNLENCNTGPKGGALILTHFEKIVSKGQLVYVNLNGNHMSSIIGEIIGKALLLPGCKLKVLYLASNDLLSDGGEFIIRGVLQSLYLQDLDLRDNFFTEAIAESISLIPRGIYREGVRLADSPLRRINISNNPGIGSLGSRVIFGGLASGIQMSHIIASNIGMRGDVAPILNSSLRDAGTLWKVLDISHNDISKEAMNTIFWALRHNRHLRVFRAASNSRIGPLFGTDEDALLRHGVSIVRCLRESNRTLREIDLSGNLLVSGACVNILDALIDNFTVKKIILSHNNFHDDISDTLSIFLQNNRIVEHLDLSYNKLGSESLVALCNSLTVNHTLKVLNVAYNDLSNAGTLTAPSLLYLLTNNNTLKSLNIDGNKFGGEYTQQSILPAIIRNQSLQQLSLRDNRLDSYTGGLLLGVYRRSPTLLELGVSRDEIGSSVWEEFVGVYNSKRCLSGSRLDMLSETQIKGNVEEEFMEWYYRLDPYLDYQ